jgi:hypothetical protein
MKKLSSILLIFFCISSFAQQDSEITYLSCTGTENATSFYKNPKGETQDISTDFTLNFNAQQKKVTGGTRMLALGCFPTEDIDLAFPQFSRHLIMSKLNWRESHEENEIYV